MDEHSTDYLVVGAGAMGMGFADSLFDLSDARITLVDLHDRPGGHWNDAYPFVRLHQPSAFYGLNSRTLGTDAVDTAGTNCGLHEMASGQQVLDHFDAVLRQKLLPSGRVKLLSMTEHVGMDPAGMQRVRSLLNGTEGGIRVRRKIVHATHTGTRVPATHSPRFAIAAGVRCVPPNALPHIARAHSRYTVVGAGKTGMDACLWLLLNGAEPARIRWIMPSDAWFLDRANVQPGAEHLDRFFGSLAAQFECVARAASLEDLFVQLESQGQLLRLDRSVSPTRYRCATVTRQELAELRRIRSVLRLGHVQEIGVDRVVLEKGVVGALPGELFIDCSACGIPSRPGIPVFQGDEAIHLQLVRQCAPSFSAAFIAAVECLVEAGAEARNDMCQPVPLPQDDTSWVTMHATTLANRQRWSRHERLMQWLAASRLDYGTRMRSQVSPQVMERYIRSVKAAAPQWPGLVAACGLQRAEQHPAPAASGFQEPGEPARSSCVRRQPAGGEPVARLNARENAASDS
ncbi:hypothetical protein QTH87_20745 [Variovorax sp. J22P168]|uniref:hypothetical protein n=1 Tax=Variovorax jilinensis TaxID=3053513 RepID=UPI002578BB09|nr:hypothetical protein [Variovorax sp. J22P168]MDM0014885.1 hypothetical protein [Variovorax sp. J22P168]